MLDSLVIMLKSIVCWYSVTDWVSSLYPLQTINTYLMKTLADVDPVH